jgi:hypothetical protein
MKKIFTGLLALAVLWLVCRPCSASPSTLAITGSVRQPLNLTRQDLNRFDAIRVQLNERIANAATIPKFTNPGWTSFNEKSGFPNSL